MAIVRDKLLEGWKPSMASRPSKRSIRISGRETSVTLEMQFWKQLSRISRQSGRDIQTIISEIDKIKGNVCLSTALRSFILHRVNNWLQEAYVKEVKLMSKAGEAKMDESRILGRISNAINILRNKEKWDASSVNCRNSAIAMLENGDYIA